MSHLGVSALTLPSTEIPTDSLISVKATNAPFHQPSPIKDVQGGYNKREIKAESKVLQRDEDEERKLGSSGK